SPRERLRQSSRDQTAGRSHRARVRSDFQTACQSADHLQSRPCECPDRPLWPLSTHKPPDHVTGMLPPRPVTGTAAHDLGGTASELRLIVTRTAELAPDIIPGCGSGPWQLSNRTPSSDE